MAQQVVLAIDEGTTNSKAVLVDQNGRIIASGSAPVPIEHPQSGWVQQDADDIWTATKKAIADCLKQVPNCEITALGWQCRRTAPACDALKAAGHEPSVIAKTGLPLDPMFPPTKAAWLVAQFGEDAADICIGTVDSWLIWKLSGGEVHATDRSNAARTQLFNLTDGTWDDELCALFGVDIAALPRVCDSSHIFGQTQGVGVIPDGLPIAAAIGDSHAALFGHGAFGTGDGKITFGTGSSVMTTVPQFTMPPKGITTTIAWSLNGISTYALEGNILVSASVFPWTAELLGLADVDALLDLAQTVDDAGGVSLVPAHVGLGSPHWDSQARGLLAGLSFKSTPAHIARAAADSLAHQVTDIFDIMAREIKAREGADIGRLFVDGGPSANPFLMQLVADYLTKPVTPCRNAEASALGAAHLAGLATGVWPDLDALAALAAHGDPYAPMISPETQQTARTTWREAIARTILRL